jgi:hypothetical protein
MIHALRAFSCPGTEAVHRGKSLVAELCRPYALAVIIMLVKEC